jgi:hypothetical protein
MTVGIARLEMGCFGLWVYALAQRNRRATLIGKESPQLSVGQAALSGLISAVTWEHPREKAPDPIQWVLRTVIDPMAIADIMEVVKSGRRHTLSPELEGACVEIAGLSSAWAQSLNFALLSYEEALPTDPVAVNPGPEFSTRCAPIRL